MSAGSGEAAYGWLPIAAVAGWVKKDPAADGLETVRLAAAQWCQDQRPDLLDVAGVFQATDRVVQAGILAAARLIDRHGSGTAPVNYAESAASTLRLDPDVALLLGRPRVPAVG